jgi:hypothetical protein
MRHRVPGAFLSAFLANGRAQLAHVGRQLAASCHVANREPADCGAIDIELDAARHLGDVLLLQAGGGAVIASKGTVVAGVDTGFEMPMRHVALLKEGATN